MYILQNRYGGDDDLDESKIKCLTKSRKGMHSNIVFDSRFTCFVDTYSSRSKPPRVVLCDANTGKEISTVYDASEQKITQKLLSRMKLVKPEIRKIRSFDDEDDLFMLTYRPDEKIHGKGPYPCIVSVYGGPHVRSIRSKSTLEHQHSNINRYSTSTTIGQVRWICVHRNYASQDTL